MRTAWIHQTAIALVACAAIPSAHAWGDREQAALAGAVIGGLIAGQSRQIAPAVPMAAPVYSAPPQTVYVPPPTYYAPPTTYYAPSTTYYSAPATYYGPPVVQYQAAPGYPLVEVRPMPWGRHGWGGWHGHGGGYGDRYRY